MAIPPPADKPPLRIVPITRQRSIPWCVLHRRVWLRFQHVYLQSRRLRTTLCSQPIRAGADDVCLTVHLRIHPGSTQQALARIIGAPAPPDSVTH